MFEKTQVFGAASHALVVLSTNRVAGVSSAATVAVGATVPPVQATTGTDAPETKNPEGKLMVMALALEAAARADVVKTTVTALPPGAAAAGCPGTL